MPCIIEQHTHRCQPEMGVDLDVSITGFEHAHFHAHTIDCYALSFLPQAVVWSCGKIVELYRSVVFYYRK